MAKKTVVPPKGAKMSHADQIAALEAKVLRAGFVISQKDGLIAQLQGQLAQLRQEMIVGRLRFEQGASDVASFDPVRMVFVEPSSDTGTVKKK